VLCVGVGDKLDHILTTLDFLHTHVWRVCMCVCVCLTPLQTNRALTAITATDTWLHWTLNKPNQSIQVWMLSCSEKWQLHYLTLSPPSDSVPPVIVIDEVTDPPVCHVLSLALVCAVEVCVCMWMSVWRVHVVDRVCVWGHCFHHVLGNMLPKQVWYSCATNTWNSPRTVLYH
jgi:hypothetical protein